MRVRDYSLAGDIEISTQYCSPKKFIKNEFSTKGRKKFVMRTHGKQIAENMTLTCLNESRSFSYLKENLVNQ